MKNRIIKALIIAVSTALSCHALQAQTQEHPDKGRQRQFTVGWYPLQAADGALKFDFEKRINHREKFWKIAVKANLIYNNDDQTGELWSNHFSGKEQFYELSGFGISGGYKSFLANNTYLFYEIGGGKYHVESRKTGYETIDFIPNSGLNFTTWQESPYEQDYTKLEARVNFGYQSNLQDVLFMDLFIYAGYTHSIYDRDKPCFDKFGAVGYSGILVGLGVRAGIGF
ncbi:MAG: hypothetical protein LBR06_05395 [Bacteroidales bacterium]|jgi:hypothetical protein|nr:hypothetical protein [Bacteroidales bacterium]